jgi:hypothetical protein
MPDDDHVLYSQVRPYAVARSLADLTGPTEGTVHLPIMLAWSGQRDFDLAKDHDLQHLYAIVLRKAARTTSRSTWTPPPSAASGQTSSYPPASANSGRSTSPTSPPPTEPAQWP